MRAGTESMRPGQKGYALVWVIAAITIIASLAAGVLSVTTIARKNQMMLTFDIQARLLAQSGMNYAGSRAGEILRGETAGLLSDLDGAVITSGLGSNERITLSVAASGTNPYDYVVTSVGTVNRGMLEEANYAVTNLINAPPNGTGVYIVQSKPGTAVASPTNVAVNASSLNDYTAGISFDPRFAGTGNQVDSANFNNGIGSLLNGFRAYFTFSISSGSNADGFVFASARARLVPVKGNPAAFASLLGVFDQISAANKRIDLTRLGVRADEPGKLEVELNLRIACRVPREKAS